MRRRGDDEAGPAWPDPAAPEATAAHRGRHVEEVAANAPEEGSRRKEADILRQGPEVARVVREPLELERDAPQRLRASWHLASRERFHRLAVRRGMTDRGVARQGLHVMDGALVRTARE